MVPSRRVYLLLIAGTAIALGIAAIDPWLPASGQTVSLLFALGWDGLLLAAVLLDGWRSRSSRVQVAREIAAKLSIGRENPVKLTVQSGDRPAVFSIRDGYPEAIAASPEILQTSLPANQSETLTYTVFPTRRGEYQWTSIHIRQLGAWGLAWHTWQIPQTETVAVYPDLVGLRALSIRLTLQTSGNIRRSQRLGTGTEFAELRDYSMGDDPRFIDWKATARRSRPLVRVLEPEQEQTLILLLDRGRLMTAQVQGLARFDWGLNAALALALTALNRGDRVGVGVFDRQLALWMPPERGQVHLSKLIERLTPLQPVLLEPDYLSAVTAVTRQQTRRALVVLITEIIDRTASAELLAAMARLTPRYLPFCVALRDPQVDAQAIALTDDVNSTYARAVALDLLAQRQVALATLKQKGVLVLDAPANQISDRLVDRYLQLKAHSRL